MGAKDKYFEGAVMTEEGLRYNNAVFNPTVEQCEGCNRIREFEGQTYCSAYTTPQGKWSLGLCNFSTHMRNTASTQTKVNPLKASKRSAKGKR